MMRGFLCLPIFRYIRRGRLARLPEFLLILPSLSSLSPLPRTIERPKRVIPPEVIVLLISYDMLTLLQREQAQFFFLCCCAFLRRKFSGSYGTVITRSSDSYFR
ncbi:hypothetical protein OE88DRAFT_1143635 [Heliocybe sulcata]|uniref:Uncharacterized protein n=1 Tax=Heliocybe sulcata TaxID=5364 RepID=A0A5C3N9P2_9AGAM|nr:hypothetical protein OE88DRAFT_1143635 [Heliocybe sulcata]